MEYNAILRNQSSTISEKEAAFSFFIKQYQKDAKNFAYQKIKKYLSFLPEQSEAAREIVQEASILMFQKIRNGELCRTNDTCEAWHNQLMIGLLQNLRRKSSGLPQKGDGDANAEKPLVQARLVDVDILLYKLFKHGDIKVFGIDNKIEQSHLHDDLRHKLDTLIHEVSATCKEFFATFLADEEDLFAWWKRTRAKDQNIDDPIVLKKLRSSFDATTSNCRGKMRELILKYNIKFD